MLIKKYTPDWIRHFEALKVEISKGLEGLQYRIEHIGSTAVPGLGGKDIIDIDIIYDGGKIFHGIQSGLESIGYYHNGNQGIEQREVFKRMEGETHPVLDEIRHHLYVCPLDSEALQRHLRSRDYLRNNEWARMKYQKMKHMLAEQAGQDQKVYAKLKERHANEFIDIII